MEAEGKRRRRDRGLIVLAALAVLLGGAGVWLWAALIAGDEIPTRGPSMEPTLAGRVSVEVDESAYDDTGPERGDVVTAQAPTGLRRVVCESRPSPLAPCAEAAGGLSRTYVLKRVVAVAGDRVAFDDRGRIVLDGVRRPEPYIRECGQGCSLPRAIRVPDGHVFLAGDNRELSSDSRSWGPLPISSVDGMVVSPEVSE